MSMSAICKRCLQSIKRLSLQNLNQVRLCSSSSQIPKRPPDYDLYGTGYWNEGERLVVPPEQKYVEVEESKEDWKHVENILPNELVPEPPQHDSYPTPSGWRPPTASRSDNAYFIRRTRFHNFPLYSEIHDGGSRTMTVLTKAEGDLWELEGDLRSWLEQTTGKRMYTQVCEVTSKVRVRGTYLEECSQWMVEKGF